MFRYCPRCAGQIQVRVSAGTARPACAACGFVQYEQPKVGAGTLITKDNRLLLLRRAHDPWSGHWNLPAGYLEADESPVEAALRETREETGLETEVSKLFGVFHFTDDPRGSGLLIVYCARVIGGVPATTPEVSAAAWFLAPDIPRDLCGGGHADAIRAWAVPSGTSSEQLSRTAIVGRTQL
jgi:8-oxo-dGTP diphosphatase